MNKTATQKAADSFVQQFVSNLSVNKSAAESATSKSARDCKTGNFADRTEKIASTAMRRFGQEVRAESDAQQREVIRRLKEEIERTRPFASRLQYGRP